MGERKPAVGVNWIGVASGVVLVVATAVYSVVLNPLLLDRRNCMGGVVSF